MNYTGACNKAQIVFLGHIISALAVNIEILTAVCEIIDIFLFERDGRFNCGKAINVFFVLNRKSFFLLRKAESDIVNIIGIKRSVLAFPADNSPVSGYKTVP